MVRIGVRGARPFLTSAYLLLLISPLAAALLSDPFAEPRPIARDVSVAFGFGAVGIFALQFVLIARIAPIARAFGSDRLLRFHREIALVGLGLVAAHGLLSSPPDGWRAWTPWQSGAMRPGAIAVWLLVALIGTSLWRRRLSLSYEIWQLIHLTAAVAMVTAALVHLLAVNGYSRTLAVRLALMIDVAVMAGVLLRYRLLRPLAMARRPWTIAVNAELGANTRLLRLAPIGHRGFTHEAGQFAWLATGHSPILSQQHPLSIASDRIPTGDVEFAVKAIGDWSGQVVPALAVGQRVWVDGPFGAFVPHERGSDPLVLIAGGIGIAPMRSILQALVRQADRRRVVLIYAASDTTRAVFRDELAALMTQLDGQVVYVFERPGPDWHGESGLVTQGVIERHAPGPIKACQFFICGPPAMLDELERTLREAGVADSRIHTERFKVV